MFVTPTYIFYVIMYEWLQISSSAGIIEVADGLFPLCLFLLPQNEKFCDREAQSAGTEGGKRQTLKSRGDVKHQP